MKAASPGPRPFRNSGQRHPSPGREDGRVVEIHLLPRGEQLLAQVAAQHRDELHRLLGEFAPSVPAMPAGDLP